jgi:putative oxidoreductase
VIQAEIERDLHARRALAFPIIQYDGTARNTSSSDLKNGGDVHGASVGDALRSGGENKMNTALWVVQTLLAVLYLMAGVWKVTGQAATLEKMMPGFSPASIRLVGLGEALVGLCLVLPAAARSWAMVAGWAGAILAVEAAVFVVYHLWRGAYMPAGATLILGLLAAFVAWGRFK